MKTTYAIGYHAEASRTAIHESKLAASATGSDKAQASIRVWRFGVMLLGLWMIPSLSSAQSLVDYRTNVGNGITESQSAPAPSWKWVHIGVAAQMAGNAADIATSWKQPEATRWLAEPSGPYQNRLYWQGASRKTALSGGLAGVTYLIGWRFPRTRKYMGWLNLAVGGAWAGTAVSNYVRNPAFHR